MATILKKDLPNPDDVPSAKPLVEKLTRTKARFEKARQAATKDGKVVATDPKYRAAHKRLKRRQRKLRAELLRVHALRKPAAAAAPES